MFNLLNTAASTEVMSAGGTTWLDYLVFFIFVGGVALFGCSFYFRSSKGAAAFTKAEGSLPTWVVGMSIFATFVSSISFLGLPGQALAGNWNPFVFSLSIPLATWLAAKIFIPLYRNVNSVSAYHYLEQKFGYWARCYVAICYLLTQLARIGSILLLLALPINAMFGWDVQQIIIWTGIATLIYTLLGGIAAVVWTDAIQGIILIVGALACAVLLTFSMPEGPNQLFEIAAASDKFSLGSFGASLTEATFWVVLIYGLFTNMQNYGIDQNYVQRYMTTKSTKDAVKSTLFGSLLYIPVSLVFVYIGTALFAYYTAQPDLLPSVVDGATGEELKGLAYLKNDSVFPWFIVQGLPMGLTGLVIAAIFSAGMSTVATSINSSATIVLTDFVNRFAKKEASEKKNMRVLYLASFFVGGLGIVMGLLMMSIDGVLDAWWKLASIFSGGMLGLFLLTLVCKTVRKAHGVLSVIVGLLVIAWMSLSPLWNGAHIDRDAYVATVMEQTDSIAIAQGGIEKVEIVKDVINEEQDNVEVQIRLEYKNGKKGVKTNTHQLAEIKQQELYVPQSPFYEFRSELHTYLTIVFGTTAIFLVGFILTKLFPKKN